MTKFLLFSVLAAFCAQTPDTCSKKEGCSAAPVNLESFLEKGKKTDLKPKADRESKPPQETFQPKQEEAPKKTLENPQYLLVWLLIFLGLYFYLKDKRKKGKK